MIIKPNGYDEMQVYEAQEKLPVGGYVLKIIKTKVESYTWGQVLVLAFDVIEGEYAGFYQKNFDAQQQDKKWKGTYRINLPKNDGSDMDQWNVRKLKSSMTAIEASNDGYVWNWDEKSLAGKLVGGLFGNKEYEMNGRRGFYTDCRAFCSVERIRSGNFNIPADKLLNGNTNVTNMELPEGFSAIQDDDIPF
ncbi:MAG: hypothetical protein IKW21_01265 [Lachnospiraceae bacterium]|nr:hypothetical protein [Lachnospiraceae bacterium]